MRRPVLLAVGGLLLLAGCRGKLLSTAVLTGPGAADVSFEATGKDLVLWADTDGAWQGDSESKFAAHYEVDVLAKGTKVGHLSCDTAGSSRSICGSTVTVNDSHRANCELALPCQLPKLPAGPVTLHVVGTAGPGMTNVKNMSINVREK